MSETLAKLVDILRQFWEFVFPVRVLDEFERGVCLRLGKFHRELSPGAHLVLPLGIDQVLKAYTAWNTSHLDDQSLTTKDGQQIGVTAVLTWRVSRPKVFLLDVMDQDSVLSDIVYGEVSRFVRTSPWQDVADGANLSKLTKTIRKKAFRYGIEVQDVAFSNVTKCKTLHLLGMKKEVTQ